MVEGQVWALYVSRRGSARSLGVPAIHYCNVYHMARDHASTPIGPFARKVRQRVREYGQARSLIEADALVVMVSGGQDSTCLLHLLATGAVPETSRSRLRALHVNHGLRGPESEADERLVRALCGRLEVPLTVVAAPLSKEEGNLQSRARDLRRRAALDLRESAGTEAQIALGHTLDDQVETLLYRVGRYAGLSALAGMRPRQGVWVRPLLGVRRWETARYCEEQRLSFAEDRGNVDPAYARSRLRAGVIPAWEAALPGAVETAARAAEVAAEGVDLLQVLADELLEELGFRDPAPEFGPALSLPRLSRLPRGARHLLLHRFLGRMPDFQPSEELVTAVDRLVRGTAGRLVTLPGGWVAIRDYQWLRVLAPAAADAAAGAPGGAAGLGAPAGAPPGTSGAALAANGTPPPTPLPLPGRATWGDLTITAQIVPGYRAPDVRWETYLDADALGLPVTPGSGEGHEQDGRHSGGEYLAVRAALPGDRFRALGSPGRRKLQDVMVDLGIPARLRARLPLVLCGEDIVWMAGYLTAERGRIGRSTKRVLRLGAEGGLVPLNEQNV